jgi:hypothetical protein
MGADVLRGRRREVIGLVAYIVAFLFTFFAASFLVARYNYEDPTEPLNFLLLVGASLIWPISVPLTIAIMLLLFIAKLAVGLSRGAE